ncbi:MAG TPA: tryptophan synthase subunit alpha [Thermoleophilaceae bacterium]|nr:tryptophan synthase subunit alpha [Thermoleophilaceae bacterium]
MSDRIAAAFEAAKGDGKAAALMPYLMGGFPSVERSAASGEAAIRAGADVIELGVPFSDPLADGPVIHAAGTEALAAGATPHLVLGICERLAGQVPVVLMVYANLVLAGGAGMFAAKAAAAGAAGLIVPDLPHDEAGELRAACDSEGLALVPLVAPTTTDERVREIGEVARGFVYAVSVAGTTGERDELPPGLERTVERARDATDVPVAVGFGISTAEQVRSVASIADGVIVGTRLVRAAAEGPEEVGRMVEELSRGVADRW